MLDWYRGAGVGSSHPCTSSLYGWALQFIGSSDLRILLVKQLLSICRSLSLFLSLSPRIGCGVTGTIEQL